jgi:hypothetical protein
MSVRENVLVTGGLNIWRDVELQDDACAIAPPF